MIKKIFNFTFLLIMFFIFNINVNAEDVSTRGAEFNWCDNYTKRCYITELRYNDSAQIFLVGPNNAIDYNAGKYEYLAGIRFWSEITGSTNDVISLYYTLKLTGLKETETYSNEWLNNKSSYYSSSNVTILNVALLSNTYEEDRMPTEIDGNPVFLGVQTIKFKVNVQLDGDFNENSLYIGVGSFSTANNLSSLFINQHISGVVTAFVENYYMLDNNSTIINQNDTMINQNQTIIDNSNKTNEELGNLNDSLNDSDTSDATNEAGDFFSGFETDTFGLTSIITAPLNLIGSITSSSCSPLGLKVPFVENSTLNLPCMSTIYQKHFGSFLSVYQTITFGIIAYWVCVRVFALVKDFKNPDHDEIEVLDL